MSSLWVYDVDFGLIFSIVKIALPYWRCGRSMASFIPLTLGRGLSLTDESLEDIAHRNSLVFIDEQRLPPWHLKYFRRSMIAPSGPVVIGVPLGGWVLDAAL